LIARITHPVPRRSNTLGSVPSGGNYRVTEQSRFAREFGYWRIKESILERPRTERIDITHKHGFCFWHNRDVWTVANCLSSSSRCGPRLKKSRPPVSGAGRNSPYRISPIRDLRKTARTKCDATQRTISWRLTMPLSSAGPSAVILTCILHFSDPKSGVLESVLRLFLSCAAERRQKMT